MPVIETPAPNPNVSNGHKVLLKIQQIARFRIRGVKDADICAAFNLTQSGLSRLVASPEYKEVENQVLTGVLNKLDADMTMSLDELHRKFSKGLPIAMQRLLDIATQERDLKASLEACREIFDRDPKKTFTKDENPRDPGSGRPIPTELMQQLEKECDVITRQS